MGFLRRHRPGLLFTALAATALYAHARQAQRMEEAASFLHRLAEVPLEGASRLVRALVDTGREVLGRERLQDRIRALEARVAELELERSGLLEDGRENQRLAGLLELRSGLQTAHRGARVIAANSDGTPRSVTLDAGGRDGVAGDAAVVAAGGLVGRVVRVGERTAVVQLLTDPQSGVAALVERSRVQGVLGGSGREECRLRYVPDLEDVRIGDRILASGLDGIYPRGALLGVVSKVEKGVDAFQDVRVRPAVSFASLENVLVRVDPEKGSGPSGIAAARAARPDPALRQARAVTEAGAARSARSVRPVKPVKQ